MQVTIKVTLIAILISFLILPIACVKQSVTYQDEAVIYPIVARRMLIDNDNVWKWNNVPYIF
jgi:hypothetical protein